MIPYIATFLFSVSLLAFSDKVKRSQRKYIDFFAMFALCLLAGMRAVGIGTDTRVYLEPVFEAAKHANSYGEYLNSSFHAFSWTTDYVKDMEPMFTILVLLFTKLTGSLYCVQFVVELCVVFPLYLAVKKDKNTVMWISFFVFCMCYFNPSLNMMRQSIAMSFGLLGFECWKNDEKRKALIISLFALLFHRTAILVLFVYFMYDYIVKGKILNNQNISKKSEIPRILVSIGFGVFVLVFLSVIVSILAILGYGKYLSYVLGNLSFMPNQLIVRLPQLLLILICYRRLKQQDFDVSFYFVMEVYTVIFSQLTSISDFGGRFALYFAIFDVIMIPKALLSLKTVKFGNVTKYAILLYYFVYWWYYFVFIGSHQTVPYIFIK